MIISAGNLIYQNGAFCLYSMDLSMLSHLRDSIADTDFDSDLSSAHIRYLSTATYVTEDGDEFRRLRIRNMEKVAQAAARKVA